MIELRSKLGKTRFHYQVKEDFTGQIEITRTNADGESKMWVPAYDMIDLVSRWFWPEVGKRLLGMSPLRLLQILDKLRGRL